MSYYNSAALLGGFKPYPGLTDDNIIATGTSAQELAEHGRDVLNSTYGKLTPTQRASINYAISKQKATVGQIYMAFGIAYYIDSTLLRVRRLQIEAMKKMSKAATKEEGKALYRQAMKQKRELAFTMSRIRASEDPKKRVITNWVSKIRRWMAPRRSISAAERAYLDSDDEPWVPNTAMRYLPSVRSMSNATYDKLKARLSASSQKSQAALADWRNFVKSFNSKDPYQAQEFDIGDFSISPDEVIAMDDDGGDEDEPAAPVPLFVTNT